jgi:hypothetical protein
LKKGAHLGFRYFFTEGFGLFGEAGVEYDKKTVLFGHSQTISLH